MRYEKEVALKLKGDVQLAQQYITQARVVAGELIAANINELQQLNTTKLLAPGVTCRASIIHGQVILEIIAETEHTEPERYVAGFIVKTSDNREGVIAWNPASEIWSWVPRHKFKTFIYGNIVWKNERVALSVKPFPERHAFYGSTTFQDSYTSDVYINGKLLCTMPYPAYGAAIYEDRLYVVVNDSYTGAYMYSTDYPGDYTNWDVVQISSDQLMHSAALFSESSETASFLCAAYGFFDPVKQITASLSGSVVSAGEDDVQFTQTTTWASSATYTSSYDYDPGDLTCSDYDVKYRFWRILFPSCESFDNIIDWYSDAYPIIDGGEVEGTRPPEGEVIDDLWGSHGWIWCNYQFPHPRPKPTGESRYVPISNWYACGGTYCGQFSGYYGQVTEILDKGRQRGSSASNSIMSNTTSQNSGFLFVATENDEVVKVVQHAHTNDGSTTCSLSVTDSLDWGVATCSVDTYPSEIDPNAAFEDWLFDHDYDYESVNCGWGTRQDTPIAPALPPIDCSCNPNKVRDSNSDMTHTSSGISHRETTSEGLTPQIGIWATSSSTRDMTSTNHDYNENDCLTNAAIEITSEEQTCLSASWSANSTVKFPIGFDMRCGALLYVFTDKVREGTNDPENSENNFETSVSSVRLKLPSGAELILADLDYPVCYVENTQEYQDYSCFPRFNTVGPTSIVPYCIPPNTNWSSSSTYSQIVYMTTASNLFSRWFGIRSDNYNDRPWMPDGLIARSFATSRCDIIRAGCSFQCNQDIFGHWLISVRVELQPFEVDDYNNATPIGDPIIITKTVLDAYDGDPTDIMEVVGDNPYFKDVSVMGWRKLDY